MKASGIRRTSCFNGGLTRDEMIYNTELFRLQTILEKECEIQADNEGWYIVNSDGKVIESNFVSCGDAFQSAKEQGLIILNQDDVDKWMQPPADYGVTESE